MSDLRLVVWDVDGTLIDSAAHIQGAMTYAFQHLDLPVPTPEAICSIVGLSLPQAIAQLAPDLTDAQRLAVREGYRSGFVSRAAREDASPLFPGALDALNLINDWENVLMGVATGKSRRGLDRILDAHGLRPYFVTEQVADFHPSKPHPAMLQAAMDEAGVDAAQTVMIGDTSYDIDMGKSAGVQTIAVSWGNHSAEKMAHADVLAAQFTDIPAILKQLWDL